MDSETPEFIEFRDRIDSVLKSLPDDETRGRFMQILNQLADKIDTTAVQKRAIRKDIAGAMASSLTRMAQTEGTNITVATLLQKALQEAADSPPDLGANDPEYRALQDVVRTAQARVCKLSVEAPATSVRCFDPHLKALDADRKEHEDDPMPLIKSATKDLVAQIVANLQAYKKEMVAAAPTAAEKKDTARHIDAQIAPYLAWLARES